MKPQAMVATPLDEVSLLQVSLPTQLPHMTHERGHIKRLLPKLYVPEPLWDRACIIPGAEDEWYLMNHQGIGDWKGFSTMQVNVYDRGIEMVFDRLKESVVDFRTGTYDVGTAFFKCAF